MPRPKKIKILESEIPENINELINKVKDLHPEKKEEIENIQNNINTDKKQNKKEQKLIVVDKVDNYYFDDFNGVWDNNLNLVGAYSDKKIYLYNDTKKSLKKILEKKINFIL